MAAVIPSSGGGSGNVYRILAAVQSQARSYVFYADPEGTVSYYESEVENEAVAGSPILPLYRREELTFQALGRTDDDTPVVISSDNRSSSIAAVAYVIGGRHEIRVYFVDAANHYIREICSTDGGKWTEGSGSNGQESASPGAPISGAVDYTGKGLLKVYYYRPGEENNSKKLRVWWVTIGSQAWSSRLALSRA